MDDGKRGYWFTKTSGSIDFWKSLRPNAKFMDSNSILPCMSMRVQMQKFLHYGEGHEPPKGTQFDAHEPKQHFTTIYERYGVKKNEFGMAIECTICLPDVPVVAFSQRWWRPVCPSLSFRNAGFFHFSRKVFVTSQNHFRFPAWQW